MTADTGVAAGEDDDDDGGCGGGGWNWYSNFTSCFSHRGGVSRWFQQQVWRKAWGQFNMKTDKMTQNNPMEVILKNAQPGWLITVTTKQILLDVQNMVNINIQYYDEYEWVDILGWFVINLLNYLF